MVASLNFIDALLAAVVGAGMWSGWRRGIVFASLHLLALAICFAVAFVATPFAADWVNTFYPAAGVWGAPASFIVLFIFSEFLVGSITSRVARAMPPRAHVHPVNRGLGVLPGALNGLLNATLLTLVLLSAPITDDITVATQESATANWLSEPAEWIEAQLTPIFAPAMRTVQQALRTPEAPHKSVTLNFAAVVAEPRPDLEARMLDMVNVERSRAGLRPLVADPQLREVARAHSRDMLARGYFAHVSPEGQDMGARYDRAHIQFRTAGENLVLAPDLVFAHDSLMKSPGHRANILTAQFGRAGIGVLDAGRHGLMVTQNFRN